MTKFNKEQIFIVTGASSGIGEAVSLLLNKSGASVVAIARNLNRLNEMKSKCTFPENMYIEIKDLTEDIENLPDYIKELKNKYGKFSGLAFCAGISSVIPLQAIDLHTAKQTFDINYFAPIFTVKGFCDRRNNIGRGASVVVISSVSGIKADKGQGIYAGSKAAVAASLKSFARETAQSQGIRINCISPSDIKTPLTECKIEQESPKYPLGFGDVDDAANMIVYLLSDDAKWIATQNYVLDCGYM